MKNLFRNIFLVSCLLLTVGAVEAQAQTAQSMGSHKTVTDLTADKAKTDKAKKAQLSVQERITAARQLRETKIKQKVTRTGKAQKLNNLAATPEQKALSAAKRANKAAQTK